MSTILSKNKKKGFGNELMVFKLKEILFTLFSFLMVTMSLYHVFFNSSDAVVNEQYSLYAKKVKERDEEIISYYQRIGDEKAENIYLNYKEELNKIKDHKNLYVKEFSFRGRASFHFWLYLFGLVTLGLFFSCKSLYQDIINGRNFKVYFISICGITISLFWIIHLFFMTHKDFNQHNYVGLILACSIMFGIFGYHSIKYVANKKIKRKKLFEEAKNIIEQLEKKVLAKQEEQRAEERQRISEELHDGVLGKLFGTRMGLGFLSVSNEKSKEKYYVFLNELQEIEKEIREVSHKLSVNLDGSDIGFIGIVKQLLNDKGNLGGFNYTLDIDNSINWEQVNEIGKVNLYRIIQEVLQNIIKHANAENIKVAFLSKDGNIVVDIIDDGVGFETSKAKKGIGINNIKSRVKRFQGVFNVVSQPGKGTRIKISIPLQVEEIGMS